MNKLSKNNTDPGANGCSAATAREYLTIDEFAGRVGLSAKTIRRRIEAGHLLSWQPGGPGTRILIPTSCLSFQAQPSAPSSDSSSVPDSRLQSAKLPGRLPRWKQN